MTKERLYEIDFAKGLAIFFVVIGHVVARKPPLGNEWYVWLKFIIYKFHMPFFMFLSGVVFYLSYQSITNFNQVRLFIFRKTTRLLPGFLLIGFTIFFGKILASQFLHVDNLQENLIQELVNIIINPSQSASSSLWYIYVLLEFYIFFSLFLLIFKKNVIILLFFSSFLHLFPYIYNITNLFLINRFCEYAIYFSLGFIFSVNRTSLISIMERYRILFFLFFIMSFSLIPVTSPYISKTIIGFIAIPVLYNFSISLISKKYQNIWLILGKFTFTIYLFNTIFIGLSKGVMLKFFSWDYVNFLFFFPLLLISGIFGPILIHKYLLSRIPYIGFITK